MSREREVLTHLVGRLIGFSGEDRRTRFSPTEWLYVQEARALLASPPEPESPSPQLEGAAARVVREYQACDQSPHRTRDYEGVPYALGGNALREAVAALDAELRRGREERTGPPGEEGPAGGSLLGDTAFWSLVCDPCRELGSLLLHQPITSVLLMAAAACATQRMFNVGRLARRDVSGWGIHVWQPERVVETRILTLVAVGPNGIAYDLAALAAGQYARDDERTGPLGVGPGVT